MNRNEMINTVGSNYLTANIETGEFSYVKAAGNSAALEKKLGYKPEHFKIDIRFEAQDNYGKYAVLIETKQNFNDNDEAQLAAYLEAEKALFPGEKIICILANTNDDKIKVWFSEIDDEHFLRDEKKLDSMQHYQKLFTMRGRNDRETVMKNTYALNEALHKFDIDEKLRSQFVGTCLLYVKNCVQKDFQNKKITKNIADNLVNFWAKLSQKQIISGIESVLESLLDGSENKDKKIELLQKNVLENQKVKNLTHEEWLKILEDITLNIYCYIDADSSEGQDILNLFFITFNKYTGKADKNQAFTPDHITDFMAKLTEVDRTKRVLDECCGSGSFLVQAMVKELADCRRNNNEEEADALMEKVKKQHIFGIEFEEKAYGLATTNMLIHGDGNSNIILGSCFEKKEFIVKAKPHIILMNPPYNSKPKMIPAEYQENWGKASDGKEDPTKGLVFVKYLSDIAKDEDWNGTKLAVLLPMSAAIGTSPIISKMKQALLENNTLEAVFSLPAEIFYPGASVQACCMLFTLNKPHFDEKGKPVKATFFGYYKDDGFKKKKNLGRVEQFDAKGRSKWKDIEENWLSMYRNKSVVPGLSAMQPVTGKDEWLCEAYMKTDYSKLTQGDFQRTLNNYVSYLVKTSKIENADEAVNTENWKEFRVGDVLECKTTRALDINDAVEGEIPYITRTAENNVFSFPLPLFMPVLRSFSGRGRS